jgi:hypothetical protein
VQTVYTDAQSSHPKHTHNHTDAVNAFGDSTHDVHITYAALKRLPGQNLSAAELQPRERRDVDIMDLESAGIHTLQRIKYALI